MKYRCPHCGQKGFSFTNKILPTLPRYDPKYASCDYCRGEVTSHAQWGGRVGDVLVTLVFALVWTGSGVCALLRTQNANPNSENWYFLLLWMLFGLLLVLLLLLYKYLFCYFDKPEDSGYVSADKFRFTAPATVRLWPWVRVGEIYLIRFPKRKKREDGPYLIGMVTNVEKVGETQEVTIRVVKEYLMDAPLLQEELVLTTEGDFYVDGVVSHTYRLPPEEK